MTHDVLHRHRRCGHGRRDDVLALVRSYVSEAPAPADGAREAAWGRLEALFEREAHRRAPERLDALVRGTPAGPPKDDGPRRQRWPRAVRHAVTAATAALAFVGGAGIGWMARSPGAETTHWPGARLPAPTLTADPGPTLLRAGGGELDVPASWGRVGPCPRAGGPADGAPEVAEFASLPEALRCARLAAAGATVVWLVADAGAPPLHAHRLLLHGLVVDRLVPGRVHELVVPSLGAAVVWVGQRPDALLATLRPAPAATSPPHLRLSRSQVV